MEKEVLPNPAPSTPSPEAQKKSNGKMILIGCGVAVLVLICLGIVATVVAGGSLLSFFTNNTAIVEYNNELVDERNKVIEKLYDVNNSFFYSLELDSITDSSKALSDSVDEVESAVNSKEAPKGAEDIKKLNQDYIAKVRDLISFIDKTVADYDTVYDIPDSAYDDYQAKLLEIDTLNVQIAEKLNAIVGYDAVPQEEIDKLKGDLE